MKTTHLLNSFLVLVLLLGNTPIACTVEPPSTLDDVSTAFSPLTEEFVLVDEPAELQDEPFSVLDDLSPPDHLRPASVAQSSTGDWQIECVDCSKSFRNATDRSLRLDTDGHPHITYGWHHLHYSWYDGTQWHYETVDIAPGVGEYASLALDGANRPHISYYDSINGNLKYTHWTGTAWDIQTVDSAGNVGQYTSIALDASGYPYISYYDATDGDLKCAHWIGSTWDIQTVDSIGDVGQFTSLALGAANYPHISYYDSINKNLKYAHWTGNTWDIQTVDSDWDVGRYTSLTLDAADHPHISYFKRVQVDDPDSILAPPPPPPPPPPTYDYYLKYAHWTGSMWISQVVDSWRYVDKDYDSSLALDSSDRPHISYYRGGLQYAYWTGNTWNIQTVDSIGIAHPFTSLALDAADRPHISYHDFRNDDLKYAYWTGNNWDIQTVDSMRDLGGLWHTSLALDTTGRPHISYLHNDELKYTHWTGSAWDIQTVDGMRDISQFTSLALDTTDTPHISYNRSDELKYAYWTGNTWNIQTVDSIKSSFMGYISLALDAANHPHISYYDSTNTDLKYAHWTGSNWDIQTVDSTGDVGGYASLALDKANRPHISYWDWRNDDLKYAQHNGTNWQIETVDSEELVGEYTSLALDSTDYPHISYSERTTSDSTGKDLKYAHWTGSTWDIQTVESTRYGVEFTSMALDVAEHPHISYRYRSTIKYAHWTGDAWDIQTVGRAGYLDRGPSLALDTAGFSHISFSYCDDFTDIKYAVKKIAPLSLDKHAMPSNDLHHNDALTYTLILYGPGLSARLWDPLPPSFHYIPTSITGTVAPLAVYNPTAHAVVWEGTLSTNTVQTIQFQVVPQSVGAGASPIPVANTAWLTDTDNGRSTTATTVVNVLPPPFLSKRANPGDGLRNNDTLTYTLTIFGPKLMNVHLWDPLPPPVHYVPGSITSTITPTAVYSPTAHAVVWEGTLPTDTVQTVQFQVTLGVTGTGSLDLARPIVNTAWLTDTESGWSVSATVIVNGWRVYVPVLLRNA